MESQGELFDSGNDWKKEWKDMPEFVQPSKAATRSIVIHFESQEDVDLFAKIVGRNITPNTKSFFFPVVKKEERKVYVDEP